MLLKGQQEVSLDLLHPPPDVNRSYALHEGPADYTSQRVLLDLVLLDLSFDAAETPLSHVKIGCVSRQEEGRVMSMLEHVQDSLLFVDAAVVYDNDSVAVKLGEWLVLEEAREMDTLVHLELDLESGKACHIDSHNQRHVGTSLGFTSFDKTDTAWSAA